MQNRIQGVDYFFVPTVLSFNKSMTAKTKLFIQDKKLPLKFTVGVGLSGGNQSDKDFIAFGIVECMNNQLEYNVELGRQGNCYVIKECCGEKGV
jgi:hypothetical protein